MPLIKKIKTKGLALIGIWDIQESFSELLELAAKEKLQFELPNFKDENRKREWLTVRILASVLSKQKGIHILYDEHGKPYFENQKYHLSFTHSGQYAAVIIHRNCRVGIDMEPISPKAQNVKHKFLNHYELNFINVLNNHNDFIYTLFWSAKECLYKLNGEQGLSFKNKIHIYSGYNLKESRATLSNGKLQHPMLDTSIDKGDNDQRHNKLYYLTMQNYIITYAVEGEYGLYFNPLNLDDEE